MKLTKEARKISKDLFLASFTDGKLDDSKVRSLIAEMVARKPRHCFDIVKNYHRLLRLEIEKRHAVIESAVPLSPDTSTRVVSDLRSRYGADLTTDFRVNPNLIGGLRIKIGSDVWDGSIQSRLQRLQEQFS